MAIHFTKTVLFIATETEIHDTESSKWELTSHLTADRKESAFYLGSSHTFTTSKKKLFRLTLFPRVPYVLKSNWAGEPLRCLRSPSQIDACGHRCKINQRRSEPSDTGSAFSSGGRLRNHKREGKGRERCRLRSQRAPSKGSTRADQQQVGPARKVSRGVPAEGRRRLLPAYYCPSWG